MPYNSSVFFPPKPNNNFSSQQPFPFVQKSKQKIHHLEENFFCSKTFYECRAVYSFRPTHLRHTHMKDGLFVKYVLHYRYYFFFSSFSKVLFLIPHNVNIFPKVELFAIFNNSNSFKQTKRRKMVRLPS